MSPPFVIRILMTTAAQKGWTLYKADAEATFLKTGNANQDVYVIPPRESADRTVYWLLLTAAYGLVNANAKWQHKSDEKNSGTRFKESHRDTTAVLHVPRWKVSATYCKDCR